MPTFTSTRPDDDDFEDVIVNGTPTRVLRDGRRLGVPVMMTDAARRALQRPVLHDGIGNPAGYKPGYVFSTDERNWSLSHRRLRLLSHSVIGSTLSLL
jgi:hypothetical protein